MLNHNHGICLLTWFFYQRIVYNAPYLIIYGVFVYPVHHSIIYSFIHSITHFVIYNYHSNIYCFCSLSQALKFGHITGLPDESEFVIYGAACTVSALNSFIFYLFILLHYLIFISFVLFSISSYDFFLFCIIWYIWFIEQYFIHITTFIQFSVLVIYSPLCFSILAIHLITFILFTSFILALRTGTMTATGEKVTVGCLAKIEMNVQANAMRITFRTLHPSATSALMATAKIALL